MRELPFGEHGVDAFLDGKVVADDAPPGFQDVARLVHAAKAPATAGELAGQDHVVATLAAAVGGSAGVAGSFHEGRRPMLTKLLTAKMAAAAAAAILGGGAAAAATGSLPTSLQSSVSHGLSSVGISVPNPDAHATGHAGTTSSGTTGGQGTAHRTGSTKTKPTTPPTQAVGPSATGPALYGLCTAYAASSGSQAASHSVAFSNLSAAAAAKGETVAQYCTGVTPPSTVPTTTGASHAPATAGPPSGTATASANGRGNASSHAPATAGPPSGTATASASGQGSANANSHAPATAGPPSGTATASASGQGSANANGHAPATAGPPSGTRGTSGAPGSTSTSSGSAS